MVDTQPTTTMSSNTQTINLPEGFAPVKFQPINFENLLNQHMDLVRKYDELAKRYAELLESTESPDDEEDEDWLIKKLADVVAKKLAEKKEQDEEEQDFCGYTECENIIPAYLDEDGGGIHSDEYCSSECRALQAKAELEEDEDDKNTCYKCDVEVTQDNFYRDQFNNKNWECCNDCGEEEEDKTCWTCKKEYEVEYGRGGYEGHQCFECFEKENGKDSDSGWQG